MKPIKNVCPAYQGSEKGCSVNRSESTLILVGRKRDEDKTPKTHGSSGDCSASFLKEKQKH